MDTDVSRVKDKVLMAYCTCNDFDGESLEQCLRQSYPFVTTVILDDSTEESYKNKVDAFAEKHSLKVVRRENRQGFKAGNINNYFQSEECKKEGYRYATKRKLRCCLLVFFCKMLRPTAGEFLKLSISKSSIKTA